MTKKRFDFVQWDAMPVAERLPFMTVRIVTEDANGGRGSGTGFFVDLPFGEGKLAPVVITNRHVVEKCKKGHFLMHKNEEPTTSFHQCNFEEENWFYHPDGVDLAALPLRQVVDDAKGQGVDLIWPTIREDIAQLSRSPKPIGAVEDITMIGYPIGVWDETNNFPIIRRGITATNPSVDYDGKKEFLIDAACFPGSSGSPVFVFNNGSYVQGDRMYVGSRLIFLGVLWGGPQYNASGQIIVQSIPTKNVPVPLTSIPSNLGYVIKADRVFEFSDMFMSIFGSGAASVAAVPAGE